MIEVIGWWESALALGVLALALAELFGLIQARRAGLTENVSRLVTHGLLAAFSALYAWIAVWWSGTLGGTTDVIAGARFGIANWGFLVLAGMLILVVYELVAQIGAMDMGFTRNVPRLVTHVAMATVVVLMFMMNLTRWQLYRDGLLEDRAVDTAAGGLLQAVGWWEIVLVVGVVLLAAREFVALWAARRAGKTENFSRLVYHGTLTALAVVYSWIAVNWTRDLDGTVTVGEGHPAIAEWGLFVVAGMLFVAVYSLVTLAWARRFGLTSTVKRWVTHLVMAAFVLLIGVINLSRWQMYFGLLEQSYEESIRPQGGAEPGDGSG